MCDSFLCKHVDKESLLIWRWFSVSIMWSPETSLLEAQQQLANDNKRLLSLFCLKIRVSVSSRRATYHERLRDNTTAFHFQSYPPSLFLSPSSHPQAPKTFNSFYFLSFNVFTPWTGGNRREMWQPGENQMEYIHGAESFSPWGGSQLGLLWQSFTPTRFTHWGPSTE